MTITWVVGGTSGIGRACAELLEEVPGRRVIATGNEVDVRDPDALFNFFLTNPILVQCEDERITDLIYSVGVNHLEWSQIVDPAVVLDLYHVNVVGLINVLQVVPRVRRVVVVGSDAAWREMRTSVAYCASKAALHQAVRVIARERASEDFAINVVAPGMTEPTDMQQYVDERVPLIRKWSPDQARKYEESQIPMKRRANVNEVASVVVSTLLMPTPYLNGAIIPVNGGR
jgi:NAD(P)-dependent dehydrogenase (short-subunit alcohol dehydrogenase family)